MNIMDFKSLDQNKEFAKLVAFIMTKTLQKKMM